MTDTDTAETPVLPSVDDSEGLSPIAESGHTGDTENEPQNSNREAARYRVERNTAREERDALAQRLERLQYAEVERLASEHLSAPGDITLSGKALSDYLTPEGWVDREAVADAARSVIESRPGLSKNFRFAAVDRSQGQGNDTPPKQPTFSDLLRS